MSKLNKEWHNNYSQYGYSKVEVIRARNKKMFKDKRLYDLLVQRREFKIVKYPLNIDFINSIIEDPILSFEFGKLYELDYTDKEGRTISIPKFKTISNRVTYPLSPRSSHFKGKQSLEIWVHEEHVPMIKTLEQQYLIHGINKTIDNEEAFNSSSFLKGGKVALDAGVFADFENSSSKMFNKGDKAKYQNWAKRQGK